MYRNAHMFHIIYQCKLKDLLLCTTRAEPMQMVEAPVLFTSPHCICRLAGISIHGNHTLPDASELCADPEDNLDFDRHINAKNNSSRHTRTPSSLVLILVF